MKTLKVPFRDILNEIEIEGASAILEKLGNKDEIDILNWPKEFGYKPITHFYIARSIDSLFIKYVVHGTQLKAIYTEDHSPVHTDSCVEFFCMPEGASRYINFEFNCIGTGMVSSRKSRTEDVVLLSAENMKKIKRFSSVGGAPFDEKNGNFEWNLTVKIPFKLINLDPENLPQYIRANFYKCADDTKSTHFVSWSPIKTVEPDFHRPEFFGKLEF